MIIAVNFPTNKQLERRSLKKIRASTGFETRNLRDTGAMLYQLSYEATHWEQGQFTEYISSRDIFVDGYFCDCRDAALFALLVEKQTTKKNLSTVLL